MTCINMTDKILVNNGYKPQLGDVSTQHWGWVGKKALFIKERISKQIISTLSPSHPTEILCSCSCYVICIHQELPLKVILEEQLF